MIDFRRTLHFLDQSLSEVLIVPNSKRDVLLWVEYLMSGLPWIIGSSLAVVYAVSDRWDINTLHKLVILNIGLLADLCIVGVLKLIIQRPRPVNNIDDLVVGAPIVDEYSFPSGHCARAAMLGTICARFFQKSRVIVTGLYILVAISRVAMGRHYCSDALAGIALGWLEGVVVLSLPISATKWLKKILR
ncbi:PAP2 family protein [Dictyocaulus viviparus]|uniref:PAP2 family protein n=1 Tax=Dictyocaulus viviparus TaxID=29172 RepID=A0A0D8XVD9_DICVI|nr:PAP2 family protein [Dictyocaulus viviparus]